MFDPETIANARLRRFFDYWDAKRAGRPMPARANIDPLEFSWALGDVSLIDVLPEGDFRWRLDGSNSAAFFGTEMQGRRLSEYPHPQFIEPMRAILMRPVETGEPVFITRVYAKDARRWNYDSLLLPLGEDGAHVDMLVQMLDIGRPHATK
ncbi:MAG: PAS domain-containing protein [Alphaproteobacteria bacterium]|nr:PAS domain-containing protein [Alphaproteobacteria bacterium]